LEEEEAFDFFLALLINRIASSYTEDFCWLKRLWDEILDYLPDLLPNSMYGSDKSNR
tara:strand:+ start:210 stop:380 length:171 start_codon:yes stop_codon:yes gene_type:complete